MALKINRKQLIFLVLSLVVVIIVSVFGYSALKGNRDSNDQAEIASDNLLSPNAQESVIDQDPPLSEPKTDVGTLENGDQAEIASDNLLSPNVQEQVIDQDPLLSEPKSDIGMLENNKKNIGGFLNIFLLILSFIALVVSLWVNVFLLKWRRRANESDISIVPSELLNVTKLQTREITKLKNEHAKTFKLLGKELSQFIGTLQHESNENRKLMAELLEAFSSLQIALSDKDEEIKRLRGGYDSEIFRRFLNRFVKLDKVINEEIEDLAEDNEAGRGALSQIHILLSDALAECGLNEFSPDLGESIRNTVGVDENHRTKPTSDPDKVLTIAEVLEPGLRFSTPDGGFQYVKKARVVVYIENEEAA